MPDLDRRTLIEPSHQHIPIVRQCTLLDIPRSSFYYEAEHESPENVWLCHRIDEIFTKYPFYGVPRITETLRREGRLVNHKRIERLMHIMGLEAVYPKKRKNMSQSCPLHRTYPYLLRNVAITEPNQVWSTDITYVRLERGFCYLVAHLDWYSRYVLAWEVSLSLETAFCLDSLDRALLVATPGTHNSDQGSQFTSEEYTGRLERAGIAISMDGRGRCFDNIFIERLWRSVKYEDVYLKGYRTVDEARDGLAAYFPFYNTERPHQSLNYQTPAEIYFGAKD